MKALRRSIKGDKEKGAIAPKSAVAIVPPKKVIRALYDYEARSSQELSFSRGDFFHVIGRENDQDWYEACNPALPDARGLVPVTFFQALGRTERDSAQSDGGQPPMPTKNPDHDSGYSEAPPMQPAAQPAAQPAPAASMPPNHRASKSIGKTGAMVYGIVMYDFAAERADELEAKAGEAIIVIAQSNPEWFVAKPIGRLGGPGLIPVSFVEIRDMASDKAIVNPSEAIKRAGVPKVEEWNRTFSCRELTGLDWGAPLIPTVNLHSHSRSANEGPQNATATWPLPPTQLSAFSLPPATRWRLLRLWVTLLTSITFVESSSSRFFTPFGLARLSRLCFFRPRAGWFVRPAADRDFIAQSPSSSVDPNIHLSFFSA